MSDPRRKLVLEDGTWRYRIGRQAVQLWTPAGRKIFVWKHDINHAVTGWVSSDSCYEHDGVMITPGLLRQYIERVRP